MKTISSRTLKRGCPEETLQAGESLQVKKSNGKRFELRRLEDAPRTSFLDGWREVMTEIPNPRKGGPKVNVVALLREEV